MKYKPDSILIDASVEHLPVTQSIIGKFKNVDLTVIEDIYSIKKPLDFTSSKKTWLITAMKGEAFKPCQGMGKGHFCCNYWILDLISNCPMDCSYCILQSYLYNNPLLTIYANIDEILTRAAMFTSKHKEKAFRIGTGELSDSLALDDITGFSKRLIEYFSNQPNVTLELKTKTINIDHLLKVNHKGKTVIGWSVNPQKTIDAEEAGTAPLFKRFEAASRAIEAGYDIAFHFDPIIYSEKWEEDYKYVVDEILQRFRHKKIRWISLGTLRFPPDMKEIATKRFPRSRIFYNELVPVNGKVRYFRPIREKIYKKMIEYLAPIKESTPIYLCMETGTIWQHTMPDIGTSNSSIEKFVCKSPG